MTIQQLKEFAEKWNTEKSNIVCGLYRSELIELLEDIETQIQILKFEHCEDSEQAYLTYKQKIGWSESRIERLETRLAELTSFSNQQTEYLKRSEKIRKELPPVDALNHIKGKMEWKEQEVKLGTTK